MTVLVNSSTTTAGTIGVAVYDSTGTQVTQTGGTMVDITPGSANTWTAQTPTSANINFSSGTFTASSTFSLDLRLTAPTSGNINVGTITLTYLRAY
jgi:type 1 fimbria pilin